MQLTTTYTVMEVWADGSAHTHSGCGASQPLAEETLRTLRRQFADANLFIRIGWTNDEDFL